MSVVVVVALSCDDVSSVDSQGGALFTCDGTTASPWPACQVLVLVTRCSRTNFRSLARSPADANGLVCAALSTVRETTPSSPPGDAELVSGIIPGWWMFTQNDAGATGAESECGEFAVACFVYS